MPYIQVRSNRPIASARLGAEITRLMADTLGKRREVTVVEVVPSAADWYVNGTPVAGAAAQADIKITQGTNTAEQKARLLAEFQSLLQEEIGPLAAPAYVVIHEIPGTDWGYEGVPQSVRLGGGSETAGSLTIHSRSQP